MKVIIDNFQIISHAELDFIVGINHISGLNGSGKSSIIEAIRCAMLNPSGTSDVISWWAKECRVTLEDDDNSITWIRNKTTSSYLNNKDNTHINKASKLSIKDISTLPCCILPNGNLLNVPSRWSTLFPFGESGSSMFKLFEDLFEISKCTSVIERFRSKESDYKKSIMLTKDKICEYEFKIDNISNTLSKINIKSLDDLSTYVINLEATYLDIKNDLTKLESCSYLNIDIPEIISINILDDFDKLINRLYNIKEDIDFYENNNKFIDVNFDNLDNILIPNNLLDSFNYLQTIKSDLNLIEMSQANINNYNTDLDALNELLSSLNNEIKAFKSCPLCGKEL